MRAPWLAWSGAVVCTAACGTGDEDVRTDFAALTPASSAPRARDVGDPEGAQVGAGERAVRADGSGDVELPDLVLDAAYLTDTLLVDVVTVDDDCLVRDGCVTGLGNRRVLRFGSRTGNIGSADFVLGRAERNSPLWTFDECRQRFDLRDFARYVLLDRRTGEVVAEGAKHGFCIADAETWEDGSGASCRVYDCDYQGISRDCADNYGSALPCQWVDVTGVNAGEYDLQVTINAARAVAESNYENNVVRVAVSLPGQGAGVAR